MGKVMIFLFELNSYPINASSLSSLEFRFENVENVITDQPTSNMTPNKAFQYCLVRIYFMVYAGTKFFSIFQKVQSGSEAQLAPHLIDSGFIPFR